MKSFVSVPSAFMEENRSIRTNLKALLRLLLILFLLIALYSALFPELPEETRIHVIFIGWQSGYRRAHSNAGEIRIFPCHAFESNSSMTRGLLG